SGRNVIRDTVMTGVTTPGFILGWNTATGLWSLFKKKEAYRTWLFNGGAQATIVSLDRNYLRHNLNELTKRTGLLTRAKNVVLLKGGVKDSLKRLNPIEALRVITELGENATRLGAFEVTRKRLLKQGMSEQNAAKQAAFMAREVTDFGRMGSKMRGANMLYAFLNARIQGTVRTAKAFRDTPARATFMATATITLPSILLWWWNKDDPKYQSLSQWQKDLFWIIPTDDHIWRIPKAHVLGLVFGTLPEHILQAWYDNDPKALKDLGKTFSMDSMASLVPQAFVPFIEEATNTSLFRNRPLIPKRLEDQLPEYQYTEYTTELSKALGRTMAGIPGMQFSNYSSPIVIDNFIRQWTGGLGQYAIQLADKALRETGILPDPVKPAQTLADIPLIKAFVVRHPSANTSHIEEFFTRFQQKEKVFTSFETLAKQGNADAAIAVINTDRSALVQLTNIRKVVGELNSLIRLIQQNPNFTPDEMRQHMDQTYVRLNSVAQLGNQIMDRLEATMNEEIMSEVVPDTTEQETVIKELGEPVSSSEQLGEREQLIKEIKTTMNLQFDMPTIKAALDIKNTVDIDTLVAKDILINALIHQESRGKSGAISKDKDGNPIAYGLMQVLPSTAMSPGLGVPPMTGTKQQVIKKLLDPAQALQFGTTYFNALLYKYGGNSFHALLAYHSGAGFTDKWIKNGSNINQMGPEGRKYVKFISEFVTKGTPNYIKRFRKF
ncbi:hypothetical protein LCGC14_1823920, partial [marine sediment metagenome]